MYFGGHICYQRIYGTSAHDSQMIHDNDISKISLTDV
jgi:hypothetical protein